MRKIMTVVLYLAIVLLCSFEVVPKLITSLEQNPSSVPYAAHDNDKRNISEAIDYQQLLEKSGALGDMKTL